MNDEAGSEEKQIDLRLTIVRFSTLTDLDSSEILSSLWCYSLGCAQMILLDKLQGVFEQQFKRKKQQFFPCTCVRCLSSASTIHKGLAARGMQQRGSGSRKLS